MSFNWAWWLKFKILWTAMLSVTIKVPVFHDVILFVPDLCSHTSLWVYRVLRQKNNLFDGNQSSGWVRVQPTVWHSSSSKICFQSIGTILVWRIGVSWINHFSITFTWVNIDMVLFVVDVEVHYWKWRKLHAVSWFVSKRDSLMSTDTNTASLPGFKLW